MPPLGLLTVAAMLPNDWQKKISAQKVIDHSKAAGKVVVAGGPVFTNMSDRFKNVDHFIKGEAEVTLSHFLADLAQGKAKASYSSSLKPELNLTPIPHGI